MPSSSLRVKDVRLVRLFFLPSLGILTHVQIRLRRPLRLSSRSACRCPLGNDRHRPDLHSEPDAFAAVGGRAARALCMPFLLSGALGDGGPKGCARKDGAAAGGIGRKLSFGRARRWDRDGAIQSALFQRRENRGRSARLLHDDRCGARLGRDSRRDCPPQGA